MRAANAPGNLTLEKAIDACVASNISQMITHHHGIFTLNTVSPEKSSIGGWPMRGVRLG